MDYNTAGDALSNIRSARTYVSSLKSSVDNQMVVKTNVESLKGSIDKVSSSLAAVTNNLDDSSTTISSIMNEMRNIEIKVKGDYNA